MQLKNPLLPFILWVATIVVGMILWIGFQSDPVISNTGITIVVLCIAVPVWVRGIKGIFFS